MKTHKEFSATGVVAFVQHGMRLKRTPRTGWIKKGIESPESVSDHSHMTSFIALALAREKGLDEGKVFRMASLHDIGEAIIGDVVWENGAVIQKDKQASKHSNEKEAITKIFNLIHDEETKAILLEFLEQKTPEAKLVKECDKLEMLFQALEYEAAVPNPDVLVEFWENVAKYITSDEAWQVFEELKKKSKITLPLPVRKA